MRHHITMNKLKTQNKPTNLKGDQRSQKPQKPILQLQSNQTRSFSDNKTYNHNSQPYINQINLYTNKFKVSPLIN